MIEKLDKNPDSPYVWVVELLPRSVIAALWPTCALYYRMADGFSEDVASSANAAEAAASPGPCTKSIATPTQDLAKVEMMLLSIYWYLYYDQDVPSVLNQSWPTVWRIFEQMKPDASLAFKRTPMRKHLLDEGYTCQPEGVVGNEGLRRRSIVKLRREGLIVGKGKQRDLVPQKKQAIVEAAWIVARDIIEKSIGSFPAKFSILREIEPEKMTWSSTEQALDREPIALKDGKAEQAPAAQTEFGNALDRDTLIGYLKTAQSDLGLQTQLELANYLGVSDAMVRKAYAGKATIDTLSDYLRRCGVEVQTRAVKAPSIDESAILLTKG